MFRSRKQYFNRLLGEMSDRIIGATNCCIICFITDSNIPALKRVPQMSSGKLVAGLIQKAVGQGEALQNNPVALRQIIARLDGDRQVCGCCDIKPVLPVLNAKVRSRSLDCWVPNHSRNIDGRRNVSFIRDHQSIGFKLAPARGAGQVIRSG